MKRLLILLLTAFIAISLFGCAKKEDQSASFDSFVDELLVKIIDPKDASFNQLFMDPEAIGIEKKTVEWPSYDAMENREFTSECDAMYQELMTYQKDDLSDRQKETYDVLAWALKPTEEEYIDAFYYIANNPLGTYTGILSNVMITFYYFNINDKKDIENFINLMETLDDLAQELLAFEQERQDKGYGMTQTEVEMSIDDVTKTLANGDYGFIVERFSEKVEATDLEDSTKEAYITQVSSNFKSHMDGFYTAILDGLQDLTIKQADGATLYDVPYGKEYYEQLVYTYTGFDDMDEYEAYVEKLINKYAFKIIELYSQDIPTDPIYDSDDPNEVIAHIKEAMQEDFPTTSDVAYEMVIAPKALESLMGGTTAFYVIHALDDPQGSQELTLVGDYSDSDFLTIAHEGYPGHMYQNVYDANENETPYVLKVISIGGYSEGYANYVERYSVKYADNPLLAELNKALETLTTLYCVSIDYKMHYLGQDGAKDLAALIGVGEDSDLISPLIKQLQMSPGIFIQYYVSGALFDDLYQEVNEISGKEISDLEYHTAILAHGPMPLDILREYVIADFSY